MQTRVSLRAIGFLGFHKFEYAPAAARQGLVHLLDGKVRELPWLVALGCMWSSLPPPAVEKAKCLVGGGRSGGDIKPGSRPS